MQNLSNLLHRYAQLIDQGELREVAELLQHCSIVDPDGNVMASGDQEIYAMYSGMIRIYEETGTPRTQHVVSNFSVFEESDLAARSSAYFNVQQKKSSGQIETIICGRYENKYALIDNGWWIVEHQMFPLEVADMSEHLLIDLGL